MKIRPNTVGVGLIYWRRKSYIRTRQANFSAFDAICLLATEKCLIEALRRSVVRYKQHVQA